MASNKSFQQVASTDSGEKSIQIQPIKENQKEPDLATFVTTHSSSFISQVKNSLLIPEKDVAVTISNPSSFGSTSEIKNNKISLKPHNDIIINPENNMESNTSKEKQSHKPSLPTGWNPPSISSSGTNLAFNKPTTATPGATNLGTGVSQVKPSAPNSSQNSNFNLVDKSNKDLKPVSVANSAQVVPKSNHATFGSTKTNTNVMAGSQTSKSEKPPVSNSFSSNSISHNVSSTKDHGSSLATKDVSKNSNSTVSSVFKSDTTLSKPSVLKKDNNGDHSANQSSAQAISKPPVTGSVGSMITKSSHDIVDKANIAHSSINSLSKPMASANPVPVSKINALSGNQASVVKSVNLNVEKVIESKPISDIGKGYTTKPITKINEAPSSKPLFTPVVLPAASKPVLPEVTPSTISKPAPPKVTEAAISNPVVPQSVTSKPATTTINQPTVPKLVSSSVGQMPVAEKGSIADKPDVKKIVSTPIKQKEIISSSLAKDEISTVKTKSDKQVASLDRQTVSVNKNIQNEKESKQPASSTTKNASSNDKDKSSSISKSASKNIQNTTSKEPTKSSDDRVADKSDISGKKDVDNSKPVSTVEFKKPLDAITKDSAKTSKVSLENTLVPKPDSQEKSPSKKLSVSFSEKNISDSSKSAKDAKTPADAPKPASGTKRSSEEINKKQDVKSSNNTKKKRSGAFINDIPDRKDTLGKLFICGKGSSQLGLSKKNAELPEFTSVENLQSNVVDVSCGLNHSLVLTSDGDIYSWGDNSKHALGRSDVASTPSKVVFDDEVVIVQIAAGNSFSAALTDSGKVYAWGTFMSDNEVLGFYESAGTSQETPIKIGDKLPKGTEFTKIIAGKDHLLLLTSKGRIYAMGDMKYGQLGVRLLRQKKDDDIPQGLRLNCLSLSNVVQIFACGYHSFAINKKDEVYSWGRNNYYQCGIPSSSPSYDVTIEIPTLSVSITNLGECKIFGGDFFTLVLNEDGELYGLGLAENGLLGVSIEKTTFATIEDKKVLEDPEHIIFPNSAEVTHVATGSNHSIVYAASKLYSWGTEAVATGHSKVVNSPTVINSSESENLLMLSAGYQHSIFLVASSETMC